MPDQCLLKQDFIFKLMVQLSKYHLQTQGRESVSGPVDTHAFLSKIPAPWNPSIALQLKIYKEIISPL